MSLAKTKIGLPNIKITFKQAENEVIARSDRGTVVLIIRDDTDGSDGVHVYTQRSMLAADAAKFSTENYQYINDAMLAGPSQVTVIGIASAGAIADALAAADRLGYTGRLVVADGTADDYAAIVAYVKKAEAADISWHGLVYGVPSIDCKHVENLSSDNTAKVVWADSARGTTSGADALPLLAGILSACNVERSATYYVIDAIADIQANAESSTTIDADIDSGNLCLLRDQNKIRIARGVNTLQTINNTDSTNDMRFIDVVEVIDLVRDEVKRMFLDSYVGKRKNSADNQGLFTGEIISYFADLASRDILDKNYDNSASVDAVAMRSYWESTGLDTAKMDDAAIINRVIGRDVYVAMDFKPLQAMEGLTAVGTFVS